MKETLHELIDGLMSANGWDYAYAVGYAHGIDDRVNKRQPEINQLDNTDFGKGYWKAFGARKANQ